MMFTMVVEFRDALTAATTFDERESFHLDPKPNDNWMIWVGRKQQIRGKTPWTFYHYAWGLIDAPVSDGMSYKHSTQSTTFLVGKLVFHSFSTRQPVFRVVPSMFGLKYGVRPVWPVPEQEFSKLMGVPPVMSPEDIHRLSRTMVEAVEPDYPDPISHKSHRTRNP